MKKSPELNPLAPKPNLDFSKGVRQASGACAKGTNLMLIVPDSVEAFPDSDSVNEALRSLKRLAEREVSARH